MLILSSLTTEHLINAYLYLSFYNISLIIFGWVLLNTQTTEIQTLYSLGHFRFNNFYLLVLVVTIFSIAGVPPFMGFFPKVLVMVNLINMNFTLIYWLLTPLLLLTLYFYIQNIRFLYTTTLSSVNYPYLGNERVVLVFLYTVILLLNYQIFGLMWFDKAVLLFTWLLI